MNFLRTGARVRDDHTHLANDDVISQQATRQRQDGRRSEYGGICDRTFYRQRQLSPQRVGLKGPEQPLLAGRHMDVKPDLQVFQSRVQRLTRNGVADRNHAKLPHPGFGFGEPYALVVR